MMSRPNSNASFVISGITQFGDDCQIWWDHQNWQKHPTAESWLGLHFLYTCIVTSQSGCQPSKHRALVDLSGVPGEGTHSMLGDMDVPPLWPLFFWHSGDWTWSFRGTFSHPLTPKRSFGVLKLPTNPYRIRYFFYPKFHFSFHLCVSNFQRPVAHPPPPPPGRGDLLH